MSVLLHDCETTWTGINDGTQVLSTDKQEGTYSVKLTTTGADCYIYEDMSSTDISNEDSIQLWIKGESIFTGVFWIFSDQIWSNGYSWNLDFTTDWQLITLDLTTPDDTIGAGANLSDIRRIRLDINNTPFIGYIDFVTAGIAFTNTDTLILSDEIKVSMRPERATLADTLDLSDELKFETETQESADTTNLSDKIEFLLTKNKELSDPLAISDDIEILLSYELDDTLDISDAISVSTVQTVRSDIDNKFGMLASVLSDIDNKVGFIGRTLSDINNKIGFLKSWQVPGDAGYQSLGKTYIRLYINSVEQTDVDIDSITISKILNGSHSANFILGRPYDNSKPSQESTVEIKYHIWTLYKGYITQITPTNSPDSIKITCQNKHWKRNKTKKYFFVGHKPQDNQELYYNRISEGLSACGASFDVGEFIPQSMSCFGLGESECISNLVTNTGNCGWYYDVDETKKLWVAGQGDIINLERQEIGKNLGLYQVLSHSFKESIENIVNKFRVQMGDIVVRRFNYSGGTKEYTGHDYEYLYVNASPGWDSAHEILAKDSSTGHGVFYHPVAKNDLYEDVFTKYNLPTLDSELESWTDRYPPLVSLLVPFGYWKCSFGDFKWYQGEKRITEGFTIDYEKNTLTFNEPVYLFQTDSNGEISAIRRPTISLQLWKEKYYSNTEDPSDDPTSDISNPLMFFTEKIGDYSETILVNLELSGFGIQIGGWYVNGYDEDENPIWTYAPSWNDTLFAKDYANWKLTKDADITINGSIDVALDTIQFYNISLEKRIMIDGILENPLNIVGISYNIGSWTASIQLENGRYYKRTVSVPSRGE